MTDDPALTPPPAYNDDDLVYVDPTSRTVIGRVEWSNSGKPKSLAIPTPPPDVEEEGKDKGRRRPRKTRYYPWGTYRSMKHLFKLEGKQRWEESHSSLDEAIEKAMKEPFWD